MINIKVYLKSGQCFNVIAKNFSCKYDSLTGRLISFKCEDAVEAPIYLDVTQVVAIVQCQGDRDGKGAKSV